MNNISAKLIDGKQIASRLRKELKLKIEKWIENGNRPPCLKAILVGNDSASKKYIKNKMLAAEEVGIKSETINLPDTVSENDLIKKIYELNNDNDVDGILIQLPVPAHISEETICSAVDPRKDIDGFHYNNIGKLTLNMETFIPCTALGVIELIRQSNIETFGKNIVICGRSKHVGLPIALLLHSDAKYVSPGLEATVTLCHRNTPNEELTFFTKRADIIISATGVVNLIKPEMIKPGATVIDVGITEITSNGKKKLVGDVDFDGCKKIAGYITPVPGGVGPMTVACLMLNTFKAAKQLLK